MPLKIDFSVITGANERLVLTCLESLYESLGFIECEAKVTVTCNEPGTDLSTRLRARFPGIRTIDNTVRRGFAANHNVVIRDSTATYIWILNDDLVFLPDSVSGVTEFLEARGNERVAAISPRLLNPDGSLQPSTYGFPSMPQILLAHSGLRDHRLVDRALKRLAPLLRKREGSSRFWDHGRTVDVDTFRGACMAVRMEAVRDVGPMVEVSLIGSEETEWHRRFHEHGWRVVFFPGASVMHIGSQTVSSPSGNLYHEYLRGHLYFFRTGRSPVSYFAFCASLMGMFALKAGHAWLRRDDVALDTALRYWRVTFEGAMSGLTPRTRRGGNEP